MWVCIDKALIKGKLKSQNMKNTCRPYAKMAVFILFFCSYLKEHCHAIWQLNKKLEGVLAPIDSKTNDPVLLLKTI